MTGSLDTRAHSPRRNHPVTTPIPDQSASAPLIRPESLHFRLSCVVVLLTALAAPAQSAVPDLDEIRSYAAAGAPDLAIRLVDRYQPPLTGDGGVWLEWEQERIRMNAVRHRWQAIIDRLKTLESGLPAPLRNWAQTERADALLNAGQGSTARRLLLSLIWGGESSDSPVFSRWRRMIIRGFLLENRVEDARSALARYRQDYGAADPEWTLLQARVLLRTGRAREAAEVLTDVRTSAARTVYLLARLRSGLSSPEKVVKAARRLTNPKGNPAGVRFRAWATLAEAAAAGRDTVRAISALERALALLRTVSADPLFSLRADDLWNAYQSLARKLGNKRQLLLGNDADWLKEAERLSSTSPVKARAVYALLANNARSEADRHKAQLGFERLLMRNRYGTEVLRQLYLVSDRFGDLRAVPESVRYTLAEQALAESDMETASQLLRGLRNEPGGGDALFWSLRTARVFILAGRNDEGITALRNLLNQPPGAFTRPQAERILQVLFDLQSIGRHDAALDLFHVLLGRSEDPALRREILYWIADSHKALGNHLAAARMYLQSAAQPGNPALDLWAQSALYQAAGSLVAAGLIQDARTLYNRLLGITKDAGRRAVIERNLQQLLLKENRGEQSG